MKNKLFYFNPTITIPFWGLAGAMALIVIAGLEHNALAVIPIFGAVIILSTLTTKINPSQKLFTQLFKTIFFTQFIMDAIDYVYIITVVNNSMLLETLYGHLWRVLLMFGLSALLALVFAFVFSVIIKMVNSLSFS